TNMLSNAIKFYEPGETVWLSIIVNCEYLQIEVQDQGRGIPQDKLQIIFERFQQVDTLNSHYYATKQFLRVRKT
ncbi:MAG: ATP-binding protein, partial [Cyanobacteria bacterium J06639_18]